MRAVRLFPSVPVSCGPLAVGSERAGDGWLKGSPQGVELKITTEEERGRGKYCKVVQRVTINQS